MFTFDAIFGYKEYRLTGEDFERFFGAAVDADLHIHAIRPIEGGITFRAWILTEGKLHAIAEDLGLTLERISAGGLPLFIYRYKNRYGLLAGILTVAVFIFIMSFFIFDITVEGNTLIYEEDILAVLEENGLYRGAVASDIDCKELKLILLQEFENIAYAYVNVKGSYAEVKITERELPPDLPASTPCNIVASENGQIIRFETYKGEAVALRGQGVEKGQLLVSGVIDSKRIGYRTVHASALIMARTMQTIEIYQPYKTSKWEESGEEETLYVIDILGLKIPIGSQNTAFDAYHEEKEKTALTLPNGKILPITTVKTVRFELKEEEVLLTKDQAVEYLQKQLSERERIEFRGLEIEEKNQNITLTDEGVTLTATYTVIKDIAEEREIYISLPNAE